MRRALLVLAASTCVITTAHASVTPRPEFVRGIYVPMGALRTPATRARLLAMSSRAGLNTWVIDI